jgi:UDP-glucuronate decarboxylase
MFMTLGSDAKLVYKEPVVDDPKQRRPDIALANSWLNWAPKVDFNRVNRIFIDLFRLR